MEDLTDKLETISPWRQSFDRHFVRAVERLGKAVTIHWLALANLSLFVFVALAALSPALVASGLSFAGGIIFSIYKAFCHQLPYRSYFIFGHQMAFCQRDFAIYSSMLAAGLIFVIVRNRLRPIDWRLYIALILPMAVDGFSQLFGWRESNWQLRTITGALFGAGTVWLMYPYVEMGMKDARSVFEGGQRDMVVRVSGDSLSRPPGGGDAG